MFGHGQKKIPLDMIHFTARNIKIQNHSQLNDILAQIILSDQMLAKIGQLLFHAQYRVGQKIIRIGYIVEFYFILLFS